MMWVYRLHLEHAKKFLSGGDAIDAETAHRIGLVSPVWWAGEIAEPGVIVNMPMLTWPGGQR